MSASLSDPTPIVAPAAPRTEAAVLAWVADVLAPTRRQRVSNPAELAAAQGGSLDVLVADAATGAPEAWARVLHVAAQAVVVLGAPDVQAMRRVIGASLADADIYPITIDDGSTALLVLRGPASPHPRDAPAARFNALVDQHPDCLRLAELRVCARATIAFYADHEPRIWEYPSIAGLVLEHLPAGSEIADVGSGVSPVAPWLTSFGYVVDTIDPSPQHRTWPPAPDWNEWDFLDYAVAGLARHSRNTTLERVPADVSYDGILSVSVIEHLPAEQRRALVAEMARRLRPGGVVLLTVDVVRDSELLWNQIRGQDVEHSSLHGTVQDLVRELGHAGFADVRSDIVRDWADTPVDIGVFVARIA